MWLVCVCVWGVYEFVMCVWCVYECSVCMCGVCLSVVCVCVLVCTCVMFVCNNCIYIYHCLLWADEDACVWCVVSS